MLRTHTTADLEKSIGNVVKVAGWVSSLKNQEGKFFITLRDRYGNTVIIASDIPQLSRGDHILVEGKVVEEPFLHIEASRILLLSKAVSYMDETQNFKEDAKIRYRYIYLRRREMQVLLEERFKAQLLVRNFLASKGFIEVETPYLTNLIPEGADLFLVKSKKFPNKYWALAQSPQIYKQLLMIAGFDRYFQFARCFREESRKSHYQPEFTQLDFEIAYAEPVDIMRLASNIVKLLYSSLRGISPSRYVAMKYDEAMKKFGTVNVDLRYPYPLKEIGDFVLLPLIDSFSKEDLESLRASVGKYTIYFVKVENGEFLKKPFNLPASAREILEDGLYLAIEKPVEAYELKRIREFLIEFYALKVKTSIVWITNIPLFIRTATGNIRFYHNPFIKPLATLKEIEENPLGVRTLGMELYINGVEVGSGGIRNIDKGLLEKILLLGGYTKNDLDKYLGFYLKALEFAPPPHGGFAFGFDRLLQTILLKESIRDVIAFPKSSSGKGLLEGAPVEVDEGV